MKVAPHSGVGAIRFGMSRAEVRRVLGCAPRVPKARVREAEDVDRFDTPKLRVYYRQGTVVAVEVSPPTTLEYDGFSLLTVSARAARAWARDASGGLDDEECGFYSKRLGLRMSADWIDVSDEELRECGDDPERPAQAIMVFSPGYYDD